jgi:2,3-diketo-5-methylthio-1-phosphopentane phosphatase
VVFDFDETAAVQNVAHMLLAAFAEGRDKPHVEAMRAGRMSFRVYQEMAFNETRATLAEMADHVREHAVLRPGFVDAVHAARDAGADVGVASAGLDFYIRAALDEAGIGWLPVTSVRASREGREEPLRYDYAAGREGCANKWATCKCAVIEAARTAGRRVIFAGDGTRSDSCAAAKADVVFARARLLEHCQAAGIKAHEFEDFTSLRHLVSNE